MTATLVAFGTFDALVPPGGLASSGPIDLVEGANSILITATDEAGNVTQTTRNVILDLTAPIVTVDSPLDGARFGPGQNPIAVTAQVDDLTATTVSSTPTGVAGNLPAGGGIAAGIVTLDEGTNTIQVSALDASGQSASGSVTVVFDTTAPEVDIAGPADGDPVRGIVDVLVAASDPLPGSDVARVDVEVDGTLHESLTAAPWETSLDTTVLADGDATP